MSFMELYTAADIHHVFYSILGGEGIILSSAICRGVVFGGSPTRTINILYVYWFVFQHQKKKTRARLLNIELFGWQGSDRHSLWLSVCWVTKKMEGASDNVAIPAANQATAVALVMALYAFLCVIHITGNISPARAYWPIYGVMRVWKAPLRNRRALSTTSATPIIIRFNLPQLSGEGLFRLHRGFSQSSFHR